MKSCHTDYEEGIIQIVASGDMEITCPGYEKKIYVKSNPRYEGNLTELEFQNPESYES